MNKEVIKYVVKDRVALAFMATLIISTLIVAVLLSFWLRPSDVQIPIRFVGYDGNLYNDRWYERLGFVGFLWMQSIFTIVLSAVMHARGYRILSYLFVSIGIFLCVGVAIVASAITQTVTL